MAYIAGIDRTFVGPGQGLAPCSGAAAAVDDTRWPKRV